MKYSYFQQESIDAICSHFESKSFALCADEAGLGKTLIARGVIERLADKKLRSQLSDSNTIGALGDWWSSFTQKNTTLSGTGNATDNRKKRVEQAFRVVKHQPDWSYPNRTSLKKVWEELTPINPDEWFLLVKALPALVTAFNGGERWPGYDFDFGAWPREVLQPFRVLYMCSNLAIAEQNRSKLSITPLRGGQKAVTVSGKQITIPNAPDRLTVLRYYLENAATPYLELFPVTATISKIKTPGSAFEKWWLKQKYPEDSLECARKKESGEALKNAQFDLVIFDEFQNFGDVISLIKRKPQPQGSEVPEKDYARIKLVCEQLYPNNPPKTLMLSATPFHTLRDNGEFANISLGDIITLLDGDSDEYNKCKTKQERENYLFDIGITRNERKNLLGDRYTPSFIPVKCGINNLLTYAFAMHGSGQGNRAISLVRSTPDCWKAKKSESESDDYAGAETYENVSAWQEFESVDGLPHPRYETLKNLVFAPSAAETNENDEVAKCDAGELNKLLWIPPVHPSHPLGGVFRKYAGFSKSIVFSDLKAAPIAICELLNKAVPCEGVTISDRDDNLTKYNDLKQIFGGDKNLTGYFLEMLEACGGGCFGEKPVVNAEDVIQYCKDGCLADVIAEFRAIHGKDADKALKKSFQYGKSIQWGFAQKMDENDVNQPDSGATLRGSFNTPFRPFVVMTTSIGREGLDFHRYCDRLIHYSLPKNEIDWEQKNGRIDRYDSLAVRRRWASVGAFWELWERNAIEEATAGLSPHWDAGTGFLHYYFLYTEWTGEKRRFQELCKAVREYRTAIGSDGRVSEDALDLSPYSRKKHGLR